MSILDFVLKTPFNHLGRTEAGNAILLVSEADYALLRSLASRTADQPEAAPAVEYESVGWQYKFPGIFCEWTWRDSPGSYNGNNYVDSREIFAKRTADNSAGGDNGGG